MRRLFTLILAAVITAALVQAPGESQGKSLWPDSRIDCAETHWEITVEEPDGDPATVLFSRKVIMLCGWMMDGWEMFVVKKRGCVVKPEDRWWMRAVDAERVRQCFR